MRRIHYAVAFLSTAVLLAAGAQGQEVQEPPPVPLTLSQLLKVQARTLRSVEQVGYKKKWDYETMTPEGVRTGLREGLWELLWLKGKAEVRTLKDEGSTGSGLDLPDDEWSEFARWVGGFYSPDCLTKFSGYEERDGRLTLRYITHYLGGRSCFNGVTWTDGQGRVLEAKGRRMPARVRRADGSEVLWPYCRVWMRPDGLPDRMEANDVLVLSMDQPDGWERDKNGNIQPRKVKVRHSFKYYDYRRPKTGEPEVIEQGDVADEP